MGLFDLLTRPNRYALNVPAMPLLESPNQSSSLNKVIFAEYFTGEQGELTREAALQVPAFKKARDLIVGTVAGCRLVEYEDGREVDQPWLYRTMSGISPWHRMAYIVDDIFFYDWSAIAVERDGNEQIVDAIHVPFNRWTVDQHSGEVTVDFKPATQRELILIPGNGSGGILAAGAQTIKGATALMRAWVGRAQNPIPLIVLQQQTDDEFEDGEIDEILDEYAAARTSPTGAVAFADKRIKPEALGAVQTDLFESGRNAFVLDAARITSVPAALLEGSQSTATLTYSTTEGKRSEFDDYATPIWMDPIQARLSMDDVSRPGRVIRFDRSHRTAVTAPALTQPLGD